MLSPTALNGREVGEIPVATASSTAGTGSGIGSGIGSGSLTAEIQEIGMVPQSELGKVLGSGMGTVSSGVSGVSGTTGTGAGTGLGVGGNVAEGNVSGSGPGFKVVSEVHRQAGTLGL